MNIAKYKLLRNKQIQKVLEKEELYMKRMKEKEG
jgi:hypothetical protein